MNNTTNMPLGLQIILPDPQKVFQNRTRCSDPDKPLKYLIWKPIFPTPVIMFRPTVKDALQNRRKDRTHAGSSDVTQLYGFMSNSYKS